MVRELAGQGVKPAFSDNTIGQPPHHTTMQHRKNKLTPIEKLALAPVTQQKRLFVLCAGRIEYKPRAREQGAPLAEAQGVVMCAFYGLRRSTEVVMVRRFTNQTKNGSLTT